MKRLVLLLVATIMIAVTLNAQNNWEVDNEQDYMYNAVVWGQPYLYSDKSKLLSMGIYLPKEKEKIAIQILRNAGLQDFSKKHTIYCMITTYEDEKIVIKSDINVHYSLLDDKEDLISISFITDAKNLFDYKRVDFFFVEYMTEELCYASVDIDKLYKFIKSQK